MITESEQKKLNQDYAEYLAERDLLAAEGKAIGTFLAWAAKNGKNEIKVEGKKGDQRQAS
jgi:hypothetical protein